MKMYLSRLIYREIYLESYYSIRNGKYRDTISLRRTVYNSFSEKRRHVDNKIVREWDNNNKFEYFFNKQCKRAWISTWNRLKI